MSLSEDNYDGLTTQGRAPLDPSTVLPPRRICDRGAAPPRATTRVCPYGEGDGFRVGDPGTEGVPFRRDGFLPPQE